jgi:hypothetical protein
MKRRNFLIGAGGAAIGGSALLGSGAFSRVESQRQVTVQVANDENAYLRLKPLDTPNSNNFVELDDHGHLTMDIGAHDDAADENRDVNSSALGVNSDSFTYFDGMFEICNQGKAEADISYELPVDSDGDPDPPENRSYNETWTAPDPAYDEKVLTFYYDGTTDGDGSTSDERILVQPGESLPLPLGECVTVGVRTVTKGVDATLDDPLVDGEVVITAVSDDAGTT